MTIALLAVALTGCATRGPLTPACDDFAPEPLAPGKVVASVQQDQDDAPDDGILAASERMAPSPSSMEQAMQAAFAPPSTEADLQPCAKLDPIARALVDQSGGCGAPEMLARRRTTVLLLSGGGQWGAFGAGFLAALDQRRMAPEATVITGVSTGAMQALLLADYRADRFERLVDEYTISDEREVVDRGPKWKAVLTGSVAGLSPLVEKINRVLCDDDAIRHGAASGAPNCLLTRLADPRAARVSVAFVENESGRLMVADVNRLAGLYTSTASSAPLAARLRQARTCVAAAALASSAMPAFYQPVRVTYRDGSTGKPVTRTMLDGGVRQSVFLPAVANRVGALLRSRGRPDASRLFVLRNGPTAGKTDIEARNPNVLGTALRAYDIVVNQLEVGSIAALRTEMASEPISLATADGPATRECIRDRDRSRKRASRMFDPAFMSCLRSVGASKAQRAEPWLGMAAVPGR